VIPARSAGVQSNHLHAYEHTKIDAVRRLEGIVELVGETYSETQTYAQVLHPTACHTLCARRVAYFRLEQSCVRSCVLTRSQALCLLLLGSVAQ
jgi:hypothetical protein